MAYDEGLAELLRSYLSGYPDIVEKRMFGGLCFMKDGHMLCGVHNDGGMFRVGKARHQAALDIDGAGPMQFTGRPMGGLVDVSDDAMADDTRRGQLMAMALQNVEELGPR